MLQMLTLYCISKTEILDVAPIDVFSGISEEFVKNFPDALVTDKMKQEALNVEFHWVNESGQTARLTAGAPVQPTVSFPATTVSLSDLDTAHIYELPTSRCSLDGSSRDGIPNDSGRDQIPSEVQ